MDWVMLVHEAGRLEGILRDWRRRMIALDMADVEAYRARLRDVYRLLDEMDD